MKLGNLKRISLSFFFFVIIIIYHLFVRKDPLKWNIEINTYVCAPTREKFYFLPIDPLISVAIRYE